MDGLCDDEFQRSGSNHHERHAGCYAFGVGDAGADLGQSQDLADVVAGVEPALLQAVGLYIQSHYQASAGTRRASTAPGAGRRPV
jgi:hypothetical protein